MLATLNYTELLPEIESIAMMAGERIMEIFPKVDHGIDYKADNSPLTKADLAANECIVKALAKLTPDIPIISEECEVPPLSERKDWEYYWLVDPLDGTKGFIERREEFTD